MGGELEILPRSRQDAQDRGLDRFFTGVPCKHGHLAARYVSTTNCVACQVEHARKNGGWQARPSKTAYLDKVRKNIEERGGEAFSTDQIASMCSLDMTLSSSMLPGLSRTVTQ